MSEFAIAYSLGEQRADLNGDTFIDSMDLSLFAENFGRTGCPERPKADLDNDGDVDGYDLAEFTMAYALDEQKADLTGDGFVDSKDVALLAGNFGRTGF